MPKHNKSRHFKTKQLSMLLALSVLVGLGAFWYFWLNDRDFDRPAIQPTCQLTRKTSKNVLNANLHEAGQTHETLRFIAFGDFGQGTPFQSQLGEQMSRLYARQPFQLALLLGDNIYPDGDIKRLSKSHFETPYANLIKNNVEFVAAIGDHDDRKGHLQDEMAYFKMPGKYYQVSRGNVDFFVLNTTFFVRSPEQIQWLKTALANSKAKWKIVIGHHPLYSSGRNGNTEGLRNVLEPLLIQYGVKFYLAGHDHDYERFSPVQGVYHIVSGGGGSFLYPFKSPREHSLVRLRTHHFLSFEIQDNQLVMTVINRFGDTVDCLCID
jgi:hypothetical protein